MSLMAVQLQEELEQQQDLEDVNHLDQLYDEDVVGDSAPIGLTGDNFYGLFADVDSPTREEDYAGGLAVLDEGGVEVAEVKPRL